MSEELFRRSCRRIPGGVNSPVRAYQAVGGVPPFIRRGEGAYLWDTRDGRYIDYVCSWGAIIVGHAHPQVIAAVTAAAENGLGFGAPMELECRFAETLCNAVPSMDMVRCVNSGTEATMSALRVARGFTARDRIIKFSGGYHGHADGLLAAAGSGALTFAPSDKNSPKNCRPSSLGVPQNAVQDTLVLPYNDPQFVLDAFRDCGDDIAAVIVEPVAGNMNCVIPSPEFLRALRAQCDKHGAVLIFDEVMTGFRVAPGGAQQHFNILPDMTCLGKVIGGGLAAAAFGGRRDIMQTLSPAGGVYQAGTLAGNPVALSAGLATLEIVLRDGFYDSLSQTAKELTAALNAAAAGLSVPFCAQSLGGLWGFYFRPTPPNNFAEIGECDNRRFAEFFHAMLARGVYLPPSPFEAGFIGIMHGENEIQKTAAAAREALLQLAATEN